MTGTETSTDSGGVVQVRFAVDDPSYPFVGLTQDADCHVEMQKMLPRGPGRYAEFFDVRGVASEQVLTLVESDGSVDSRLVADHDRGNLFEFVVSGECPAWTLSELGAIPHDVVAEDGTGRIVADIPAAADAARVVERFREAHPSIGLAAKQTKDGLTPLLTADNMSRAVAENLTDRQQEVLLAAFEAGYYDRESDTTCAKIADGLGISSSTLSQHLRSAERKLVTVFVEEYTDQT